MVSTAGFRLDYVQDTNIYLGCSWVQKYYLYSIMLDSVYNDVVAWKYVCFRWIMICSLVVGKFSLTPLLAIFYQYHNGGQQNWGSHIVPIWGSNFSVMGECFIHLATQLPWLIVRNMDKWVVYSCPKITVTHSHKGRSIFSKEGGGVKGGLEGLNHLSPHWIRQCRIEKTTQNVITKYKNRIVCVGR